MDRPLLIYDGDCGFCCYWVEYSRKLTGARVAYEPYETVAEQYPDISIVDFQRSIYLIEPNTTRTRGAEAALRTLSAVRGHSGWRWCYEHLPGFAVFCEMLYTFVSRRRVRFHKLSRLLFGDAPEPACYATVSWIYLRLLAVVYLAAFASFGLQVLGLIGSTGILPIEDYLRAAHDYYGIAVLWQLPMVFWLYANDLVLQLACIAGSLAAIVLFFGALQRLTLSIMFVLYLSLFYAGQTFMSFQWDLLLLEAGFLAILLPGGRTCVIWLHRWLMFRFMFLSGWVKLASHDPNWRNLTALQFHFETQPLPTALAWYAHQLPASILKAGVVATFFIELIVAFLLFLPRRARCVAAACFVLLETGILLTGNYNFFNILTIILCLLLIDDQALRSMLPKRWSLKPATPAPIGRAWRTLVTAGIGAVIVITSAALTLQTLSGKPLPTVVSRVLRPVVALRITSSYGLFAVMTTSRPEIVIQGSAGDGTWRDYSFRYKPGALHQAPRWNTPHQPRLDWQMWFAALRDRAHSPWLERLLVRLLEGSPEVLALLEDNPFEQQPPRFVRALLYDYQFTTFEERSGSGQWWTRSLLGTYYPEAGLSVYAQGGG